MKDKKAKKTAGEYRTAKHMTHRPDLTRIDGLRLRAKDHIIILQTEKKSRMEVLIMFWRLNHVKEIRAIVILIFAVVLIANSGNTKADFTFGEPTNLGSMFNSSVKDVPCSLSADGLEFYFFNFPSYVDDVLYRCKGDEIWVTRRLTTDDDWGEPEHLGPTINTPDDLVSDCMPHISADGLELYFISNRPGSYAGNYDIWVATRATTEEDWGEPENLGPTVNTEYDDAFPRVSGDGLTLVFGDWLVCRPGGQGYTDLWISTRATTEDPWGEPENLGETVNSPYFDSEPSLSSDGLALFFASGRPGGYGALYELWVTTRRTIDSPWSQPRHLVHPTNINDSRYKSGCPFVSADGSTLYFKSKRPGGYGDLDIWQAPIIPICDFNGDGFVNTDDLVIMIDNWETSEKLFDIGPMPWGDGVVDIEDLTVFIKYWELENMPELTGDAE